MSVFSLVGRRRLCFYKDFNLTPSEVCQACKIFYQCSIYSGGMHPQKFFNFEPSESGFEAF